MLPRRHKLTSPRQFRKTIKCGTRAGSRTMVIHHHRQGPGTAYVPGPRFGLIVSKAVGNAVSRHRLSRQLRHICLELAADLDPTCDIVIRALPAAGDASSSQLSRDMRKALRKLGAWAEP